MNVAAAYYLADAPIACLYQVSAAFTYLVRHVVLVPHWRYNCLILHGFNKNNVMAHALLCYPRIETRSKEHSQEDLMNIQALIRRALGTAACALALVAPASYAVTAPLTDTGFANGNEVFTINPPNETVLAGGFVGLFGTTPITFWCAEITQLFPPDGQLYTAVGYSNPTLSALFTEVSAASRIDTPSDSAAFQLAVWEILFEGSATRDVTSGTFTASGTDSAAQAQANFWLNHLGAANVQLVLLQNASYQDFITDVMPPGLQTPEPASLSLLGIGLFAVMFATRRRARNASV